MPLIVFLVFINFIGYKGGDDIIKEIPEGQSVLAIGADEKIYSRVKIRPHSDILDDRIIHQNFDYSCGSAALSTLLNFYLGEKLTEKQVIHGLLRYGDSEQIAERRAFSLLDMKKFVKVLGYKGIGYKAELIDLQELETPCILPIKLMGYRHFTVFKGIYKGHIFLADPFKGHTSYTLSEFEEMWYENVIFVVYPEGAKTRKGLSLKEEDLRFVDEDSTYSILYKDIYDAKALPQRRIDDRKGVIQYYNNR